MHKLIAFWKKDLLNKFILFTGVALVVGIFLLAYLLATMPERSLLMETYFPNMGSNSGVPTLAPRPITPTSPPTPTTKPYPTLEPTSPVATLSATPMQAGSTPLPTPTPTGTATSLPTQAPTLAPTLQGGPAACIPSNPVETGRALEVLDGNTIRVLIADKVYVVRYLGVTVPPTSGNAASPFGAAASLENGRLVYGKDVQLFKDATDRDPNGRLLRYVTVGDVFVNYELIYRGLGTTTESVPDLACARQFANAEAQARQARAGQWSVAPAP